MARTDEFFTVGIHLRGNSGMIPARRACEFVHGHRVDDSQSAARALTILTQTASYSALSLALIFLCAAPSTLGADTQPMQDAADPDRHCGVHIGIQRWVFILRPETGGCRRTLYYRDRSSHGVRLNVLGFWVRSQRYQLVNSVTLSP